MIYALMLQNAGLTVLTNAYIDESIQSSPNDPECENSKRRRKRAISCKLKINKMVRLCASVYQRHSFKDMGIIFNGFSGIDQCY